MRLPILHEGAKYLEYEIRQIVEDANKLKELGLEITWENIGDPVAMGETIEPWIVEKVQNLLFNSKTWAYCPTRGLLQTREFLSEQINKRGGAQTTANDILCFNGVADAVDKVYKLIHRNARVLLPNPIYSTHSSNESMRMGYDNVQFRLDPYNKWQPDIENIRMQVKYNKSIAGIGLVNPDNPTGAVYKREALEDIVEICRRNKLFMIVDEIYSHICYNGARTLHISEIVQDVPAIALRGISKEYPWPGSRCGWIEVLNQDKNPDFKEYIQSIFNAKMLEVCSTTLPQMSIPEVVGDSRYPAHLRRRAKMFEKRANEVYDIFENVPGVIVNRTQGAFYFSVVFEDGVLNDKQTLPIENPEIRACVEQLAKGKSPDKRFVYYLLGSEGICVTPLSGFATDLKGFRITLLNCDDEKRPQIYHRIANAITAYLGS